jgi:hypothetical protein
MKRGVGKWLAGRSTQKRVFKGVPREDVECYNNIIQKLFSDGEELWYPYESEPPEFTVMEKKSLTQRQMQVYGNEDV